MGETEELANGNRHLILRASHKDYWSVNPGGVATETSTKAVSVLQDRTYGESLSKKHITINKRLVSRSSRNVYF